MGELLRAGGVAVASHGEWTPAWSFSCSGERYILATWSRSLVPKPGAGADVFVDATCGPTDAPSVYDPGPGEVAARLTWSYLKRLVELKTHAGWLAALDASCFPKAPLSLYTIGPGDSMPWRALLWSSDTKHLAVLSRVDEPKP